MKPHQNQISDKQLIENYLEGNQSSLEKLITRHKEKVYTYIYLLIKDRALADDLFQDTFIKVINTLRSGSYNEEGKFIPWVMRIAHNLVIDHFRKNQRIPVVDNKDDYNFFNTYKVFDENVEDKMVVEQIHKEVRNLVDLLPEEQKEVLIMRHYADMSFKEIAEQTNVSINTALGRMRYALINLRKLISEKKISLVA
jgi:RNA polymerase sigma factor (sigma-70 family)